MDPSCNAPEACPDCDAPGPWPAGRCPDCDGTATLPPAWDADDEAAWREELRESIGPDPGDDG